MEVEVLADAEAAARRAADLIGSAAATATAGGEVFSIALSGGGTPRKMYPLLDPEALGREEVSIFQVDERVAPDDDADRNLVHIRADLPAPALERLRPMPVLDSDLEVAAASYETQLPGALDLVHLGLGPDGHTASLVPDDPVLEVRDRRVALTAGEYQGRRRMTLTYPALDGAGQLLWLVTGEDKRDALARLLAGDRSIPAGRVAARNAVVICDRAAAG